MRLFVSYARVDKPYCIQIVNTLDVHDVWYDQRLYAGQQWWKEILRRIDWCDGFVYLLSPDSVASEYCLRELEIALEHGRQIIPVLIQPDVHLPPQLQSTHYVDLTAGLTGESVQNLLNSVYIAEQRSADIVSEPISVSPPPIHGRDKPITLDEILGLIGDAMETERYDQVIFLIKQAKINGFKSRFLDLDTMLQQAEVALERQTTIKEAEREYRQIVHLVQFRSTRRYACEAFDSFQQVFPGYDPEGVGAFCSEGGQAPPDPDPNGNEPNKIRNEDFVEDPPPPPPPPRTPYKIPLLDFVRIPEGLLNITDEHENNQPGKARTVLVPSFEISRHLVTNAQFNLFVRDDEGYSNPEWWEFSEQAWSWYRNHPQPRPSSNRKKDHPREMVTWFEAMAFTKWLSYRLDCNITLPQRLHWKRTVQVNDDRIFPWGNTFDFDRCNTRESKLRQSTPVTGYRNGCGPAEVYDLAGNVWEWCIDHTVSHSTDMTDDGHIAKYAVVGGSFVSPLERAQVNFYYNLDPRTFYASIGFRLVALST